MSCKVSFMGLGRLPMAGCISKAGPDVTCLLSLQNLKQKKWS